MKKILIVIYKFIRGIFRFLFLIIVGFVVKLIYTVFNEKGKEKQITIKKAKRIRALTNFKLFVWKYFPHLMHYLGEAEYLKFLEKKINYGL